MSAIETDAGLVEDLDFDSLALAELAAFMADSYEIDQRFNSLLFEAWNGLTVGELIELVPETEADGRLT